MAAIGWRSGTALSEQVERDHGSFNYYQLVRLLQSLLGSEQNGQTALRFRADLSAGFPGHEISRLEEDSKRGEMKLAAANYCVNGVLGPLPEPYTEWLRDQIREGEHAMTDFLDIFNHHLHLLRYRLKAARNPALHIGPPDTSPGVAFERHIMGLSDAGVQDRLPVSETDLLGFTGLWTTRRRSAPVIERILRQCLGVPLAITQFVGAWLALSPDQITRLRRTRSRLGQDSVLGTRVWDPNAQIEIRIGPLPFNEFAEFLPGNSGYTRLAGLIRLTTDRELDAPIRLQVQADTIPERHLTAQPETPTEGLRLAYTAWLQSPPGGGTREVRLQVDAFGQEAAA